MKVTLSTVNGEVYVLEVPADMELENFKVCFLLSKQLTLIAPLAVDST